MGKAGSVTLVDSQRGVLIFLGVATLIALGAILWLGPAGAWLLHILSGIVAAGVAIMAFARVALGAPNAAAGRVWQMASVLAALVCIGQLVESFTASIHAINSAGSLLLLAAAPLLLLLAARFDPLPADARRMCWLGFLGQLAGIAGDEWGQASGLAMSGAIAAHLLPLIALELYLLGISMFVAQLRHQLFLGHHRVSDIGDYARYLYATSGLFKKIRHPRIGSYTVPGHKLAFILVRLLSWLPTIAPRVRRKFGIGVWQQFRDLCVIAFRHGLDAQVYYMFELYRGERRARASGYLTRYEMKNGLYKVLTWQVAKTRKRIMLGDKLGMHRICEENGIATVPILILAEDGKLEHKCTQPQDLRQDLFLKPRQLKGSRGTEVVRYSGGTYVREDGTTLDHDGLLDYVAKRGRQAPLLVQPLIKNHPEFADLADQALMRIRVITCLDDDNRPVMTHAVLSNLCKLEPAWPVDIELGAAIDLKTGALGMMTGDKHEMWLSWSEDHPITRARVLGRIVPCWDEVEPMVLAAHAACSDRALVGWDIAIGPSGALMLEGNSYPDVDFLQRSHQCAIGDSPLGPLLYARLAELERRVATGTVRGPLDYAQDADAVTRP